MFVDKISAQKFIYIMFQHCVIYSCEIGIVFTQTRTHTHTHTHTLMHTHSNTIPSLIKFVLEKSSKLFQNKFGREKLGISEKLQTLFYEQKFFTSTPYRFLLTFHLQMPSSYWIYLFFLEILIRNENVNYIVISQLI